MALAAFKFQYDNTLSLGTLAKSHLNPAFKFQYDNTLSISTAYPYPSAFTI